MSLEAGIYGADDPIYLGQKSAYENPKESFKYVGNRIRVNLRGQSLSVCDVGCASGAFLYYLASQFTLTEGLGIDVSEKSLQQARQWVPSVEFLSDSIEEPKAVRGRKFDVCTCLGTLSIFDEIDRVIANLLSLVKTGGVLYIMDIVNDDPIDVTMRFRDVRRSTDNVWQRGFNVRSIKTYEEIFLSFGLSLEDLVWSEFQMPIEISKSDDPLRAWTIRTEEREHQLVVGTGQMLNFKVLEVHKKK